MKTKKEKVLSRVNKIIATVSMTAMMMTNPVYCTGILMVIQKTLGLIWVVYQTDPKFLAALYPSSVL